MQKNIFNQKWTIFAFDITDNTAKIGDATQITANIKIDGGVSTATNDINPTELEDGYYEFDLTQAETNGEYIRLFPASSTGNIQVIGVPGAIYTTPANFPDLSVEASTGRTDIASVAGTAQTANDNGADINSILVDTNSLNDTKIPQTLNLTASGNIGVDWANVENPTSVNDLSATDMQLVDTITTYTGNTKQTANHTANISSILTDTGTTLNNHLTDIKGTTFVKDTHSLTNIEGYVDLIDDLTSGLIKIASDLRLTVSSVAGISGSVMVGTDSALLASDVPTNFSSLGIESNGNVTKVDLVTSNTDMRGTNSAALASDYTSARAGYLDNINNHTPQTGDSYTRIGIGGAGLTDLTTDLTTILADTNELQTDWVDGGRLDSIVDAILAMLDDVRGEPGQGALAVNPDMATKVDYLYKFMRNKVITGNTSIKVYDDAGTIIDHISTISAAGNTFTRGEFITGA